LKPILGVAATGIVAVLLGKLLLALLLPFMGLVVGFLFLAAKTVLIGGLICVAIWLLRRLGRREKEAA
jgi:hypothetical protein